MPTHQARKEAWTQACEAAVQPFRLGERAGVVRGRIVGRIEALAEAVSDSAAATFVGAIPFDRREDGFLLTPEPTGPWTPGSGDPVRRPSVRLRQVPAPEDYAAQVDALTRRIAAAGDGLRKAVIARTLEIEAPDIIDPFFVHARLNGDATMRYCLPLPPLDGAPQRWLLGATPELLLSKRQGKIASHPLAGSARRSADAVEDRAAAERLLASGKDRHEHALVVEYVLDVLAPHCSHLHAPEGPSLEATQSMWHLGTRIEGVLKDPSTPCLDLVGLLHPTPAVAGVPLAAALVAIAETETIRRGFYAGAVGWANAAGDGAWHVTLRCSEIEGRHARLFAGAGIVADSVPQGEVEETEAKFQAMLSAFDCGPLPSPN
ncbi:isochorismate synthase [Palleronia marisminoris]|uniref:isochorismate synthase n=1 Tax=Palleronia marisminoris TaxID=315423 RepID=UPI000A268F39|nr:isochorismate synthase [Palleronia marisminoris]